MLCARLQGIGDGEDAFDCARTLHLATLFDMNAKYPEAITMQQAMSPVAR